MRRMDYQNLYNKEQAQKTLQLGLRLAYWGIPILVGLALLDYFHTNLHYYTFLRLFALLPMLVFIILARSLFKKSLRTVHIFHALTLAGIMCMMVAAFLVQRALENVPLSYQLASITGGLVVSIFVVFLFVGNTYKLLPYITLLPTLATMLYLYFVDQQFPIADFAYFINPILASIGAIVVATAQEKLSWREYQMRTLANRKQQQLEIEIAERQNLEMQLRKQVSIDGLTSLLNRRALLTLIEKNMHVEGVSPYFVLCYIDLDNLKLINDAYGHLEGDNVLINFAQFVSSRIRDKDTIGRVGGDEFLILFYDCRLEEAQHVVQRLQVELKEMHNIEFSYGLATYGPTRQCSLDDLIEEADKNMYAAKRKKRRLA